MISFELTIIGGILDAHDDNVDVEITLDNGEIYYATFFTVANVNSLFKKNKQGGIFWANILCFCK